MYYVTFIKNRTPAIPEPITFEQFYTALRNNATIPEPDFNETPEKPKFRTLTTGTLSNEYELDLYRKTNLFTRKFHRHLTQWATRDKNLLYTTFQIPKQSGGMRTINAPIEEFKTFQQELLQFLNTHGLHAHNCAYAYIPKRSIKDALIVHQKRNHKWFMKIDLHNFFGSCTPDFIKTQISHIPFFNSLPTTIIRNFINIATLNNGLPQGSPLSPWITNQIMIPIDFDLSQLCHQHNIAYTRYADDMLFSADTKNGVRHAEELVKSVLAGTPLTINTEKTHIGSIYGQNWNLGLMLNKDNKITIGHKNKERFRATIHNFCENPTEWNSQSCMELLGKLTYYQNIEPEYFSTLLTKYGTKYNINIHNELIRKIKGAR